MNDPWDVKSVRQSNQYVSCMKINGVPLLPPLLSKECRKEMQYYKLLAKEVEKRISVLQPYVLDSDTETSEDKTDAPELPECEPNNEFPNKVFKTGLHFDLDTVNGTGDVLDEKYDNIFQPPTNLFNSITSNVTVVETGQSKSTLSSPKFIIDLSLSINDTLRIKKDTAGESLQHSPHIVDLPERDISTSSNKQIEKDLLVDCEQELKCRKLDPSNGKVNLIININKDGISDPFPDLSHTQDGPSSLSAKSFTGSLNDIHTESMRESQNMTKLTRQRSYTLLKPGPQLQAHLEVQSLSTGVEVSSISMSESLSNLNTPCKKRRSWDLESAKVKWSSMALELKQKQMSNSRKLKKNSNKPLNSISLVKRTPQISSPSTKSAFIEKVKVSTTSKNISKSEPVQSGKKAISPVTNSISKITTDRDPKISSSVIHNKDNATPKSPVPLISKCEDPAARVKELYERIQTQQLIQMANLVEKQKREQILLQQVFEEQNNLLYKQLKTICPTTTVETQLDWADKDEEHERGPVSLSQVINHKSSDQSFGDSSMSSTLTDTNQYINHCDNVLKKSRDITGSIKKLQTTVQKSQNGTIIQSPQSQTDGSRTRTHSLTKRNVSISRKLNYDTSASSDREYEPILTDRTNDTMAGLNVTLPSDNSEECGYNKLVVNHLGLKEAAIWNVEPALVHTGHYRSHDSGIKSSEKLISVPASDRVTGAAKPTVSVKRNPPTAGERAAATTIVAYAKGFLVRRLMKTERVQGIVQTIRDALLCALQLHQDREGIRGADVDLHRRLIQQITAACYSLHDTFIASSPAERCATVAADRSRKRSLAARQPQKPFRDRMSQSYSGTIPARNKRHGPAALMTQSNYETFSGKCTPVSRSRHMSSPGRRPWR